MIGNSIPAPASSKNSAIVECAKLLLMNGRGSENLVSGTL